MRYTAASVLLAALVACASPSARPAADGGSSPSPEVSGSATLVTPQPSATGVASPTPTRTPTPDATGTVTVSEFDAGKTISLRVGQKLEVRLGADYRPATATPDGILDRTSASGGYPTKEPMVATFVARAAGNARVESSTDYACLHATPSCALPQQLWSVGIIVAPE
jgi:hypothetical protein